MRSGRGLSTASTHSEISGASFASNFPVDSVCGDLNTIFAGYKAITAGFSDDERRKMFHDNAMRIYRIDG